MLGTDDGGSDEAVDPAMLLGQGGRIGRGIADLVAARSEAGNGLMNVTRLMEVMNKAGAASGAEVEYKRRADDGTEVGECLESAPQPRNCWPCGVPPRWDYTWWGQVGQVAWRGGGRLRLLAAVVDAVAYNVTACAKLCICFQVPTDERDMERADLQMQLAQLGRMVGHLPREEKLAFSEAVRRQVRRKGGWQRNTRTSRSCTSRGAGGLVSPTGSHS
jgi:hypothetical protein